MARLFCFSFFSINYYLLRGLAAFSSFYWTSTYATKKFQNSWYSRRYIPFSPDVAPILFTKLYNSFSAFHYRRGTFRGIRSNRVKHGVVMVPWPFRGQIAVLTQCASAVGTVFAPFTVMPPVSSEFLNGLSGRTEIPRRYERDSCIRRHSSITKDTDAAIYTVGSTNCLCLSPGYI